jgi:hypothetical protein
VLAILQPDFENRNDRNAIEVFVDGGMVGFMNRQAAAEYAPIARLLAETRLALLAHTSAGPAHGP